MPKPKIPADFDQLSTEEKVEFVQTLWNRIADSNEVPDLTLEEREELDRRLREHREDPSAVRPIKDVLNDLRDRS